METTGPIISNNELLSDECQLRVRALMSDAEKILDSLPINEETKRAKITSEINSYRVALAPHKKLPNEVLANIFDICTLHGVRLPPYNNEAPLNLAQVCSKWRQIARGMPSLWNTICAVVPSTEDIEWVFGNARRAISSSGYSLISLQIHGCFIGSARCFLPIRHFVAKYGGQLKHLSLHNASASLIEFLFSMHPDYFSSLETIKIECVEKVHPPEQGPFPFKSLQNLRVFSLQDSSFHRASYVVPDPDIFGLPWAQLSELHLPTCLIKPSIAHGLLQKCNSLVNCTLALTRDSNESHNSPILLPKLKSLAIICCDDFGDFFPSIVTPNLAHLEFGYGQWKRYMVPSMGDSETWEAIIPFVGQCSAIKEFISYHPIPLHVIKALLPQAPSLTQLSLYCTTPFPGQTLLKISRGELVPVLEEIVCCVESLRPVPDAPEDRLSPRPEIVAGISRATIRRAKIVVSGSDIHLDPDDENYLQKLREKGLDITIISLSECHEQ